MPDKIYVRLGLASSVQLNMKRRIFDILCAFYHKKSYYPLPTFVIQHTGFDRTFKHRRRNA